MFIAIGQVIPTDARTNRKVIDTNHYREAAAQHEARIFIGHQVVGVHGVIAAVPNPPKPPILKPRCL